MSNIPNNLDAYWMPFTPNKDFKADPRLVVGAEGLYYTAAAGHKVMDGTAGLWCVNAGHAHPKIVGAIAAQAKELDYAGSFVFSHPGAFEFAARVADLAPDGLDHVFFANSGSESVDTALKIALGYHRMKGDGARTRLIGRERGYHGTGFGGISVGGIVKNRMYFGTLLTGVDHLPHTHNLEKNAFTRGQPEWGAHLADDLERIVALHGAGTIAAVIVEPLAGSTGVLVPPKGYLQRLRKICDEHGILLIFDEVITAFGRLGSAFASEKYGVIPDMITCAKGLTNAAVPAGACIVKREIYDAFMNGPEPLIELFHGYTYSGHPLAAAAGLASLEVYQEEGLFERAASLSGYWEEATHSLKGLPNVIDIRNEGIVSGIELAPREGAPGMRAYEAFKRCFDAGLLIRITADIIALSPPLTISREEIDKLFDILSGVLKELD